MAGGKHLTLKGRPSRQGYSFPARRRPHKTPCRHLLHCSNICGAGDAFGSFATAWHGSTGLDWLRLGYAMWAVVIVHAAGEGPRAASPSPALTRDGEK